MIKFEEISLDELKNLIYLSCENDNELVEKYHSLNLDSEEKYTLEDCVNETFQRIVDAEEEIGVDKYRVVYQGEDIGYVVLFEDILYSYAIAIKYRTKEILSLWWKGICDLFENEFVTMIYSNNTRCLNFLLKNNMEIVETEDNILMLKNI
jgi:hypothetical protein